ncbi:MAG: NAD(P)-dependent oxidoreductase [Chloroflexi bacterium]|nr:NAD(P)-dependent oxidoreductase [Chloroflexota bacterium]
MEKNILVTGAFGNLGLHTLSELVRRGQRITAFDLDTRRNRRAARSFGTGLKVVWGDIRRGEDLSPAVTGQDVVIHLAALIPHLSVTGKKSEEHPELAEQVNVGGTRNLIERMEGQPRPPRLILGSSLHVFGHTQHLPPPRRASDPVNPVEHYARHKVEKERMVRASRLQWSIFRFAAALPLRLILDRGMFEVPPGNRIEYVFGPDVAVALANGVESEEVWGRTLLIGGGARCQFVYRDLMNRILETAGVGGFPDEAFTTVPYSTDWLDTEESQRLLDYQNHTLDDYIRELRARLGGWRNVAVALRPLARWWLLRLSPFYGRA